MHVAHMHEAHMHAVRESILSERQPPPFPAFSLTCSSPFAGESDRATLLNVLEGRVSWSSPMAAHLSEDAKDFIKATLQKTPT